MELFIAKRKTKGRLGMEKVDKVKMSKSYPRGNVKQADGYQSLGLREQT